MTENQNEVMKRALNILYLIGKKYSPPSTISDEIFFKSDLLIIRYREEGGRLGILSITIFHNPSSCYLEVFRVRISGWTYKLQPELLFVFTDRGYKCVEPFLVGVEISSEYMKEYNNHYSTLAF